jgi:hypothetical protein
MSDGGRRADPDTTSAAAVEMAVSVVARGDRRQYGHVEGNWR